MVPMVTYISVYAINTAKSIFKLAFLVCIKKKKTTYMDSRCHMHSVCVPKCSLWLFCTSEASDYIYIVQWCYLGVLLLLFVIGNLPAYKPGLCYSKAWLKMAYWLNNISQKNSKVNHSPFFVWYMKCVCGFFFFKQSHLSYGYTL